MTPSHPPSPAKPAKRKHRVTQGNSHLALYAWTHPATGAQRWRVPYKQDGKWKYKTFKTKAAAVHAAATMLEQSPDALQWSTLDTESRRFLEEIHHRTRAEDRPALLAFLKSRHTSSEVTEAVTRFIAHKTSEAGEETPHLTRQKSLLENLAHHFNGQRVAEIHLPELTAWWTDRGTGLASKTRHDHRGSLITFWRWCLRQGLAGSEPITVAEKIPNVHVATGEKRVLTHLELCQILNHVQPEWRAWVALGAFAGLRPEEIAPGPEKKAAKRGLHCEEIDWDFGVIRLPAVVSKVNTPRIIPLCAALRSSLKWADIQPGMTGPVCLANPAKAGELARLGKDLFAGTWPKDALRHSYGSYRNAVLRNLGQVAEEMGTSIAMLHRHYHNPQPKAHGKDWFLIRFDPTKRTFLPHKTALDHIQDTHKTA